jgi:sugar O-acyltransferase (sialic acid O-acetyltransferase NeuD family)
MAKQLCIIGAGGHGKVVADAALFQNKWDRIFFVDDRYPSLSSVMGLEVVSTVDHFCQHAGLDIQAIVAIGDNATRERVQELLKNHIIEIATVIHPRAVVAQSVSIGAGTMILAGAVINADAKIGQGVIINTGAIVEHDCVIGDWTHLCPKVACAGGVKIGARVCVGLGSNIIQNVILGNSVTVGAGSVVLRSVDDHQQVVGVPAREKVNHDN